MNHRRFAPLLAILALGCASDGDAGSEDAPQTTNQPAASSADSAAVSSASEGAVDLAALSGIWDRDDGRRYRLVESEGRLIGYRIGEQDFGCRVDLAKDADRLQGPARFSRTRDEGSRLATTWELRVVDATTLEGTLGAFDLDPETDAIEAEATEEHTFRLQEAFDAEALAHCQAAARVHLMIDEALSADEPNVPALLTSPELQALETNPLRESVGARIKALFSKGDTLQAMLAQRETSSVPASDAAPAGEAGETASFEGAWGPKAPGSIAELTLTGDAQGWEGDYNKALESWTFEKYTPGADGFNEPNRFYLDLLPGDVPEDADGYAGRLTSDEQFQDWGSIYSEITTSEDVESGFLIEGTVRDTSDDTQTPGFVFVLRVEGAGAMKLRARGSTFADPRYRTEAVALCRALLPNLKAAAAKANEPVAHSAGHQDEMQAFLAEIKGDTDAIEAALEHFGVPGLDTEMHWYTLSEPKIVSHDGDAFVFEAKAGMTIRTYAVTWKNGKIVKAEDKGMR